MRISSGEDGGIGIIPHTGGEGEGKWRIRINIPDPAQLAGKIMSHNPGATFVLLNEPTRDSDFPVNQVIVQGSYNPATEALELLAYVTLSADHVSLGDTAADYQRFIALLNEIANTTGSYLEAQWDQKVKVIHTTAAGTKFWSFAIHDEPGDNPALYAIRFEDFSRDSVDSIQIVVELGGQSGALGIPAIGPDDIMVKLKDFADMLSSLLEAIFVETHSEKWPALSTYTFTL